jgi:hypothetical protein
MDYLEFWLSSTRRAFDFSRGWIDFIGFIILLFVGFGGWSVVKKTCPRVLSKVESIPGLQDENKRVVVIFAILFFGYVVAIGPYELFQEKASELRVLGEIPRQKFDVADIEGRKKQEELQKKLLLTESKLQDAERRVTEQNRFAEIVASARADSRKAFQDLKDRATKNDETAGISKLCVTEIETSLYAYRHIPLASFGSSMSVTIDGKPPSETKDFFRILHLAGLPVSEAQIIMSQLKHRPRAEVIRYAKQVLEQSDSLRACAATCGLLATMFGQKAEHLDFEGWLSFCKSEIKN